MTLQDSDLSQQFSTQADMKTIIPNNDNSSNADYVEHGINKSR